MLDFMPLAEQYAKIRSLEAVNKSCPGLHFPDVLAPWGVPESGDGVNADAGLMSNGLPFYSSLFLFYLTAVYIYMRLIKLDLMAHAPFRSWAGKRFFTLVFFFRILSSVAYSSSSPAKIATHFARFSCSVRLSDLSPPTHTISHNSHHH